MKNKTTPLRMVSLNQQKKLFLCISEVDLSNPKYSQMLHWHDCFELELVLSGSAIHQLNQRTYRIQKGSMYLLSPNDLHTLLPDPNPVKEPLKILNICLDYSLISTTSVNTTLTPLTAELDQPQFDFFRQLTDELLYEKKHTEFYYEEIQQHLVLAACLKLAQICKKKSMEYIGINTDADISVQSELIYIHKAIAYIKYNFKDSTLTTQRIANEIHLSHNYFGMLFKRHMGKSCLAYIIDTRMNFAISLLQHSNLTIAEISEKCGYANPPYFISSFRQKYGLPPSKYREQIQTNFQSLGI